DSSSNPVSGIGVTFAVASGGGTLTTATTTTDGSGLASTTLTLGASVGTNTVTATSGTLSGSPLTFTATGAALAPGTPVSIWDNTAVPSTTSSDPSAIECGLKFRSDIAGYITGVRFYKSTGNTGTHIGNLWSSTGTKLATVTFAGETAS